MECLLILYFVLSIFVSAGNKHFDVHFQRTGPVHLPWKYRKDAVYKNEMDGQVTSGQD